MNYATPAEAGSQIVESLRQSLAELADTRRLIEELANEMSGEQADA
jgi:hypothetical protein